MSLQQSFEPREVLPYSDSEIRDLFFEAESASPEVEAMQEATRSWVAVLEASLMCVCLYVVVALVVAAGVGVAAALWVSAAAFAVGAYVVSRRFGKKVLGPLTLVKYRSALRKARQRRASVDPYDVEVLRVVVDYVASGPIQQALLIVQSVDANRSRIEDSLKELPEIAAELACEIASTQDEGMRALLGARHGAAEQATRKLLLLDEELSRQADEAFEAVAPIRELREKFERVQRLSGNLARIQAAHGLIDRAEQSVEDHRVQLRLLRVAARTARARLHEIQNLVEASEHARTEIAAL